MSLITSAEVDSVGQTTTSLVSPALTLAVDDIIVVKGTVADSGGGKALTTPSASAGATVTWTARPTNASGSHCWVGVWTGKVTAVTGTATITAGYTGGAERHSMCVEQWRGMTLATTPATNATKTGSGAPSTTLTTVADGSIVSWICADWAAITGTITYRSSATESGHLQVSGQYCFYSAYQTAATHGSQTFGMTAPAGQTWSMIGIELQATGGADVVSTAQSASLRFGAHATTAVIDVISVAQAASGRVGVHAGASVVDVVSSARAASARVVGGRGALVEDVVSAARSAPMRLLGSKGSLATSGDVVSTGRSASLRLLGSTGSVVAVGAGYTIFTTQTPQSGGSDLQLNIGALFATTEAGDIAGVRYYKTGRLTGDTIVFLLWDVTNGVQLAMASYTETGTEPNGWVDVPITPVGIVPGVDYVVSYNSGTASGYDYTASELSASITNGPLFTAVAGGGGRYDYGPSANPTQHTDTNFYVDVDFAPSGGTDVTATATSASLRLAAPSGSVVIDVVTTASAARARLLGSRANLIEDVITTARSASARLAAPSGSYTADSGSAVTSVARSAVLRVATHSGTFSAGLIATARSAMLRAGSSPFSADIAAVLDMGASPHVRVFGSRATVTIAAGASDVVVTASSASVRMFGSRAAAAIDQSSTAASASIRVFGSKATATAAASNDVVATASSASLRVGGHTVRSVVDVVGIARAASIRIAPFTRAQLTADADYAARSAGLRLVAGRVVLTINGPGQDIIFKARLAPQKYRFTARLAEQSRRFTATLEAQP